MTRGGNVANSELCSGSGGDGRAGRPGRLGCGRGAGGSGTAFRGIGPWTGREWTTMPLRRFSR